MPTQPSFQLWEDKRKNQKCRSDLKPKEKKEKETPVTNPERQNKGQFPERKGGQWQQRQGHKRPLLCLSMLKAKICTHMPGANPETTDTHSKAFFSLYKEQGLTGRLNPTQAYTIQLWGTPGG